MKRWSNLIRIIRGPIGLQLGVWYQMSCWVAPSQSEPKIVVWVGHGFFQCQKVRSRWCRHNSKLVSWHKDKVVVHPSYVHFASDNNTPSRAWGTFEIRGLFFFRLTCELVIHVRLDIWYLCWFMFRHGTRAPNHGPSTTIPEFRKNNFHAGRFRQRSGSCCCFFIMTNS